MRNGFLAGALALGLMVAPLGCGVDDTSVEAQLEKAMMAMDAGNYNGALATLNALCPDINVCSDDILALLGEAQMGLAGIDLLGLLNQLTGTGTTNATTFGAVDTLLGTGAPDTASLQGALDALTQIAAPAASDQLRLAIAATAHMVATVVAVVDTNNDGVYNDPVSAGLGVIVTQDLPLLVQGIDAVNAALGTASDLTTDLNNLLGGLDANGDSSISDTELQNFVNTL